MRKLSCIALILFILANASIVFAIPETNTIRRTQTVYSVLDWNGMVKETSLVNWLRLDVKGEIEVRDNPELTDIISLHPTARLVENSGLHTWKIDSDGREDIFYTGKTDRELPVDINIVTKLNGEAVDIADTVGKSGQLELSFEFINKLANDEIISWEIGGEITERKEIVYTPMTVMLQADIAADGYDTLDTTGAFEMTIGDSRKYMWTLLPRPTESVTFTITDDCLILPSISISIIPKAPVLPIPEIDTSMFELMGSVGDISELTEMMEDGVSLDVTEALENIENLEGMTDAMQSMFNEQMSDIDDMSMFFEELTESLTQIRSGADGLTSLAEAHRMVLQTIRDELSNNASGIDASAKALTDAKVTTADVAGNLFSIKYYLDDISSQLDDLEDMTDDEEILSVISDLDALITKSLTKIEVVKGDADKAERLIRILSDGGELDGVSIPAISETPEMIDMLDDSLGVLLTGGEIQGQEIPGLTTTIDGLKGIKDGAGILLDGGEFDGKTVPSLAEISNMITESTDGFDVFIKGGEVNGVTIPSQDELQEMIAEFKETLESTIPMQEKMDELSAEFMSALDKVGGPEALEETSEDAEEMLMGETAKYDRMKELADEYTSFVGNTPGAVSSVLFVLKLDNSVSSEMSDTNDNSIIPIEEPNPYKDISKARLYLLIIAIAIIISAIVINWYYKRRYIDK